ncbi:MAG: hypothetical protein HQL40_08670, partial [Alphaproteobacteria bacterium]|nr:hypothetical protein [Alphaproteobacteria bacterium]
MADPLILGDGGNTVTVTASEVIGGAGGDWISLPETAANIVTVRAVETLIGGASTDYVGLAAGGRMIVAAVETLIGGAEGDWIDLGNRG